MEYVGDLYQLPDGNQQGQASFVPISAPQETWTQWLGSDIGEQTYTGLNYSKVSDADLQKISNLFNSLQGRTDITPEYLRRNWFYDPTRTGGNPSVPERIMKQYNDLVNGYTEILDSTKIVDYIDAGEGGQFPIYGTKKVPLDQYGNYQASNGLYMSIFDDDGVYYSTTKPTGWFNQGSPSAGWQRIPERSGGFMGGLRELGQVIEGIPVIGNIIETLDEAPFKAMNLNDEDIDAIKDYKHLAGIIAATYGVGGAVAGPAAAGEAAAAGGAAASSTSYGTLFAQALNAGATASEAAAYASAYGTVGGTLSAAAAPMAINAGTQLATTGEIDPAQLAIAGVSSIANPAINAGYSSLGAGNTLASGLTGATLNAGSQLISTGEVNPYSVGMAGLMSAVNAPPEQTTASTTPSGASSYLDGMFEGVTPDDFGPGMTSTPSGLEGFSAYDAGLANDLGLSSVPGADGMSQADYFNQAVNAGANQYEAAQYATGATSPNYLNPDVLEYGSQGMLDAGGSLGLTPSQTLSLTDIHLGGQNALDLSGVAPGNYWEYTYDPNTSMGGYDTGVPDYLNRFPGPGLNASQSWPDNGYDATKSTYQGTAETPTPKIDSNLIKTALNLIGGSQPSFSNSVGMMGNANSQALPNFTPAQSWYQPKATMPKKPDTTYEDYLRNQSGFSGVNYRPQMQSLWGILGG